MLELWMAAALPPIALPSIALTTTVPGDEAKPEAVTFSKPVRLEAGGAVIRTESPGYAAPALHDLDGDGILDLAVGQFAGGKIKIYRGTESGGYAAGQWLEVGGEVAEVPGVW